MATKKQNAKVYLRLAAIDHAKLKAQADSEHRTMRGFTEKVLIDYANEPFSLVDKHAEKAVEVALAPDVFKVITKQGKKADITIGQAAKQILLKRLDGQP